MRSSSWQFVKLIKVNDDVMEPVDPRKIPACLCDCDRVAAFSPVIFTISNMR